MKQQFKSINLQAASRTVVSQCNAIITEYLGQGLRLTLRQLYYQLVARDLVPNTPRSYKRVGSIVSDGREAEHKVKLRALARSITPARDPVTP